MTGRSGAAAERWAATEFARSKLEEVGIVTPVRPGVATGTYRAYWAWRIETEPYEATQLPPGSNLFEISIEVTRPGQSEPVARLVTVKVAEPAR